MEELVNSIDVSNDKFKEANISLIIDNYEDIFSDFDPRPFGERALSDDFLQECKRAARDKSEEQLELRILIPKVERKLKEEWKIKKRIKEHFAHHFKKEENKRDKIKRSGIKWVILGTAVLLCILLGIVKLDQTILGSILPILEVPSWFLIWEGMGKILIESKKIQPEYEFYRKMSKAEVNFTEF